MPHQRTRSAIIRIQKLASLWPILGILGWQERALAGAMKTLKIKKGFLISPMNQVEIPKRGIGLLPYGYWS